MLIVLFFLQVLRIDLHNNRLYLHNKSRHWKLKCVVRNRNRRWILKCFVIWYRFIRSLLTSNVEILFKFRDETSLHFVKENLKNHLKQKQHFDFFFSGNALKIFLRCSVVFLPYSAPAFWIACCCNEFSSQVMDPPCADQ